MLEVVTQRQNQPKFQTMDYDALLSAINKLHSS